MRLVRTREAQVDLLEIWVYIAEDTFEAADKVLDSIAVKCEALRDQPNIGRMRDDLAPGLRNIVTGKYVICYRVLPDTVEVVRVLHGARNLAAIFKNTDSGD